VKILVFINPGSNSLKFIAVCGMQAAQTADRVDGKKIVPRHDSSRSVGEATLSFEDPRKVKRKWMRPDQAAAARIVILEGSKIGNTSVAACRVVHGGSFAYPNPAPVDRKVIDDIEKLDDLAPLHNASLGRDSQECFSKRRPDLPVTAVFDSGFHHTIPKHAYLYALPHQVSEEHGIRPLTGSTEFRIAI